MSDLKSSGFNDDGDFVIKKGEDIAETITFEDSSGPVDLTVFDEIELEVREKFDSASAVISISLTGGGLTANSDGELGIIITSAQSADAAVLAIEKGVMDIKFSNGSDVSYPLTANVVFINRVTV